MAIMLPAELAKIFSVVTGMSWPEANEDNLRLAGDDYQVIANDMPKLKSYIVDLVNVCLQQFEGQAADAFVHTMRELIGQDGGKDQLSEAAAQALKLAKTAHDTANQVEYFKWMTIAQLVQLAFEIAFATFWSPFTFGGSMIPLAFEYAAVREAIWQIFKWLLKSIAMHTGMGVAGGLVLDGTIQSIQFNQGHRHEWDNSLTDQSLKFAVINGALSGPLDLFGMGLGKAVGGVIGKSAGSVFGHSLGDAIDAGVKDGVDAGVRDGVKDGIDAGVGDGVKDGIDAGVRDGVNDVIDAGVGDGVKDGVRRGGPRRDQNRV